MLKNLVAVAVCFCVLNGIVAMGGENKHLPPAPEYYSAILPDDSGSVKPIDMKSENL